MFEQLHHIEVDPAYWAAVRPFDPWLQTLVMQVVSAGKDPSNKLFVRLAWGTARA